MCVGECEWNPRFLLLGVTRSVVRRTLDVWLNQTNIHSSPKEGDIFTGKLPQWGCRDGIGLKFQMFVIRDY